MCRAGHSYGISTAFASALFLIACSDGAVSPGSRDGGAVDENDEPGGEPGGEPDGGDGTDGDGGIVLVDPDAGAPPPDECDEDPPIFPGAEEVDDSWDNDCDGLVDEVDVCASGDADFTTIGAAVEAAEPGGVLAVCAGTYPERLSIVDKPLSIHGVDGPAVTILDAGGDGTAVTVRDTTGTGLRIEGLTIRGGGSSNPGGGVRCETSGLRLIGAVVRDNRADGGGGLYASGCALEVLDTTFEGNTGGERGGGAYLVLSAGEVSGSTFRNNTATNGGGVHVREGAVLLRGNDLRNNAAALRGGALYHNSDAPVEDNVMADNTAGWTGGGVHIVGHQPVLRGNRVLRNNSTNDGGGIYVHQGTATLIDGEVTGNTTEDDGAGIRLFESFARVEGNLINENVAGDSGGGIRVSHQPALIVNNIIRDNEAILGGGIDMDNDSSVVRGGVIEGNRAWRGGGISAMLFPWNGGTIEGVRISGNVAGYGGGIYLDDNFYSIKLRDLEILDNVATRSGGGLFVRATNVTIRNSVLARNESEGDGGGLSVAVPEPWETPDPCPCPPTSPSIDVDFVVLHANQAATGAAVWTDTSGLSLGNSIIAGHTGNAVVALGPAPGWAYNDTFPASFSGMGDPTGSSGNISSDPVFADVDTRFALAAGSPCVNAGDPALEDNDGTRADMGRHGGPEAP